MGSATVSSSSAASSVSASGSSAPPTEPAVRTWAIVLLLHLQESLCPTLPTGGLLGGV